LAHEATAKHVHGHSRCGEPLNSIGRRDSEQIDARREDDEAILIAMRYALADVVELCGNVTPANRTGTRVIEHIVEAASLQVMLLLKTQRRPVFGGPPASLSSAA